MVMRLLVIINPHSSKTERLLGEALGHLALAGLELNLRPCAVRDAGLATLRKEGPGADGIVIAGGDGTLNGVLPALLELDKPVGIIPTGTANDLARTLAIPADPTAAAALIGLGKRRRVDVGLVNASHFMNIASLGLSVRIAENQNENLKKQFGLLSYAIAAIDTLRDAERFTATIETSDNRKKVNAYQIVVGNGVHFGGGMTVSPDADIADGMLDVYAIETDSVASLIALAPELKSGSLVEREDVTYFRSREVRISTSEEMPVSTDGEVTAQTPATFSVVPKRLEFFVP
jgi:YegS/Rv2252/BmrU family lipid kinase